MRTDKTFESFLKLSAEVNALLIRYSFERQPDNIIDDCKKLERWIRHSKWKQEIVDLSFPTKHLDCIADVGVHLRINLPYKKKGEGVMEVFDGISAAHFLGHANSNYRIPRFFGNIRLPGFTKRLVLDTEQSLSWFDSYITPAMCLRRLESGETSLGPIKSEGAAKLACEYLCSEANPTSHLM